MKASLRIFAAVFLFSVAGSVRAGDFISQVVQAGGSFTITVPGDHFLVIRNFTQEGPTFSITTRGIVTATDRSGLTGTVLVATIVDPDPTLQLEPVNNVVVAGPSTVTVTGGDSTCFITYRKGEE